MSEDRMFILKHKDIDVAILQLNNDGEIMNHHIINPMHMPYLGSTKSRHLYDWWKQRSIPEGREHLLSLLKAYDCSSPSELLMKNLGLSLTDTYWICPAELTLLWEEVNLFKNGNKTIHFHSGEGRAHYSNSPDAALNGSLDKKAINIKGKWFLDKLSNPKYDNGIQNVNESFVSFVHRQQGFSEYTAYEILGEDSEINKYSRCHFFTDEHLELITAFQVTGGYKNEESYDSSTELNKFIDICINNGLDCGYVQNFLDYMIMIDFITTNADRHWDNFGILRDPDTLKFVSMAPIYDNGNSMFFDIPQYMNRASLLRLEDNGIDKLEINRLQLVHNKTLVKTSLLPTPLKVKKYYIEHGIDSTKAKMIADSYSNKLDLFLEFQHDIPISYDREMYYYLDEVPYVKQRPNPNYKDF